jgi:flagellar operon protein (TIGR03826 family)
MNWANCTRCGQAYTRIVSARDVCPACLRQEDDNYSLVFRYLTNRPSATAQEIAQETGVDLKEIYRYVRENRLQLIKNDTGLYCESCAIPISQGKMCERCFQNLAKDLQNDIAKTKETHKTAHRIPPANPIKDPKYLKKYRGE